MCAVGNGSQEKRRRQAVMRGTAAPFISEHILWDLLCTKLVHTGLQGLHHVTLTYTAAGNKEPHTATAAAAVAAELLMAPRQTTTAVLATALLIC